MEKQRYTSIYKIPHWVYNKLGLVKKENLEIIYELVELFKKIINKKGYERNERIKIKNKWNDVRRM